MKKYLLIASGILVIVLGVVLYLFFTKDSPSVQGEFTVNSSEIDSLVDISTSEISAFVFTTQQSQNDHRLHIQFTPFLTFKVDEKEVKNFSIRNFKGDNQIGELLLIHPTDLDTETVPRTFLFTSADEIMGIEDILTLGNSIEYEVVEQATKFNQVESRGTISPFFGVIHKDIGSADYKGVLDRDGDFDSSKYLEYAQVTLDDLSTTFTFEVVIQFTDGEVYMKLFSLTLDGNIFENETSPLINLEVVR